MKNNTPPKFFLRFFRWFCHPSLLKYIEGDLLELYNERVQDIGRRKASFKFALDVILLFRPGIIRPVEAHTNLTNYDMLKNYFLIGWRSLAKQRMYSAIKVGGFAIGIAACLLIALFINDEFKYDTQYRNNIYRVVGVLNENGEAQGGLPFPAPMSLALKENFPEVVLAGRFNASELFGAGSNEVRTGDQIENAYDAGFTYFDQELIDMLQLKFVYGNPSLALSQLNSIVITQRKAEKYFPNQNPVGKTLIVNNEIDKPYTIGGVIEDFTHSHIGFDFLISTTGLEFWEGEQQDWGASNYVTYVMVDPNADITKLEKTISDRMIEKYFVPLVVQGGSSLEDAKKFFKEKNAHLELQPLSEVHLHSASIQDGIPQGDIRFIWLFGGIAGFILLIAVVNFINLSTAKSANRAKEVGLRKVAGSYRSNIISQFLTESILYSMLSFVFALLLASLLLPYFNELAAKNLFFPWKEWWLLPFLLGVSIIVGIVAGIYPSFYLSSFQPIQVLKGSLSRGSKGSSLRSALVVFQFTTSVVLLVGTFIIYRQMDFILTKKIGFDKDQVLLIQGANTLGNQVNTFKDELLALRNVEGVSISDYLPINGTKRNQNQFWEEGKMGHEQSVNGQIWKVDFDYIKTMGMKIKEGRNFNSSIPSDSSSTLVNETMAKALGGNVLGKRIVNSGNLGLTIIGVVEDFHFESMKQNIENLCLTIGSSPSIVAVRINTADITQVVSAVTATWKKLAPQQAIRFSFMNEHYTAMYADVQRIGRIFTSFAVLAIIVACLGLFALSAFMVEQRTKEIGIRIVLGASLKGIFKLLTIDFIKLVLLAIIIAIPLAWYFMEKWLQDFAYRTDITWEVFAVAGTLAVLIAILTISYQAIRAGYVDISKSLRQD